MRSKGEGKRGVQRWLGEGEGEMAELDSEESDGG